MTAVIPLQIWWSGSSYDRGHRNGVIGRDMGFREGSPWEGLP